MQADLLLVAALLRRGRSLDHCSGALSLLDPLLGREIGALAAVIVLILIMVMVTAAVLVIMIFRWTVTTYVSVTVLNLLRSCFTYIFNYD